ncbi:hypothetical protein L1987_52954 [Smallanthus sonchifolius]|uniref:Uncharacterized protein n=1 Tax=Smallanthus sonchifolius TaxID=185202 RepID=A0ACB9EU87_9ASTR|nr:hypothetical protein L1987_52954 [Smallanthus sonchifolius]
MASLFEPPLSTSFFSNNSISNSQFNLLDANFSPTPKTGQTILFLPSKHSSTVCAVAIDPPDSASRDRRKIVRVAWEKLVRWSRSLRSKAKTDVLERTNKVVVLGGGSFGTAMASLVAGRKEQMEVNMLVRDPQICQSINKDHSNCKYFPDHKLPENVIATMDAKTAFTGADFCLHAVPVQFSCSFLEGVAEYVEPGLPFISLSKGLELNTLRMMSQIIPQTLKNSRQPYVALSGPSFALELMNKLPTAMVVASKDKKLAKSVQQLLASKNLRISTTRWITLSMAFKVVMFTFGPLSALCVASPVCNSSLYSDVTGVEIAGALKNVLAIAAGIVEGLDLGNNSMAALVAQGCSEIRWLSTKVWTSASSKCICRG